MNRRQCSFRMEPAVAAGITGSICGGLISIAATVPSSALTCYILFAFGAGVGGVAGAMSAGFVRDEEVPRRWAVVAGTLWGALIGTVVVPPVHFVLFAVFFSAPFPLNYLFEVFS